MQVLTDKPTKTLNKQKQTNNADRINEYLTSMRTEINPSPNYKSIILNTVNRLSQFHNRKPFARMKREDTIFFLDSLRRADKDDPMHKWIGTYNLYLTVLTRFFKWLYNQLHPFFCFWYPQFLLLAKESSVYWYCNIPILLYIANRS